MAHKNGSRVEPNDLVIERVDSIFEIEDQISISSISAEIEENCNKVNVVSSNNRSGKNKIQPIDVIKSIDGLEEQLGTSAIFNQSVEEGKIALEIKSESS